jgi:putative ubiquitin-RnfH superfamily antitoxin RatB of RatAB toxin-antitoxin module
MHLPKGQQSYMEVEVAFALNAEMQTIISVDIPENSSILDAIKTSNILNIFQEINLEKNKVGIFGEIYNLDKKLKEGDRVEIYRSLLIDPMTKRFQRVKKERKK